MDRPIARWSGMRPVAIRGDADEVFVATTFVSINMINVAICSSIVNRTHEHMKDCLADALYSMNGCL